MLVEAITDLINATISFTRHERGAYNADTGKYEPGSATTFSGIGCVMQPAFGLNRVVGGADMQGRVDGQQTTTVYAFETLTELRTRRAPEGSDPGWDPDIVHYKNCDWTVDRVEDWGFDDEHYYHVVMAKVTGGKS